MNIHRRAFLLSLPLAAQQPCGSGASRFTAEIDDVSPSYKHTKEVIAKQKDVIAALGPGDEFKLIEVGGEFSPDKVKIQCAMPPVPAGLLTPAARPRDVVAKQGGIDQLWAAVSARQRSINAFLDGPRRVQGPTPLFETLAYVAAQLARSAAAEKRLVIFSDMVHDHAGQSSPYPPRGDGPAFTGVAVCALFVPWTDSFPKREAAWRKWFLERGACGFQMLDSAQSQVATVLPRSSVPRVVQQRF
jgi:hypothetical protein